MYTSGFINRTTPHTISHYAPFATPWGMHKTIQHTDNQAHNFTNTSNALQKNTTHKWGIAQNTSTPAGKSRSSLSFPL
jgi:hypothetical protein